MCEQTDRQTDRQNISLSSGTNRDIFPFFSYPFDSCTEGVCIWFVQYSTLLYIMHSFCLHSFRASANPLCLLHIEYFPLISQSCCSVVQFLLGFRNNVFVLCYFIFCSVKCNLLWVKWDDRKHMETSFVAYFVFCPVISRRVERRLLSTYVTSGMNIESQRRTKRNRIKQHNRTFDFSQHNLLFTQHTGFGRGGVFGGSPGYEAEVACLIVLVFLLSGTS